MSIAKSIILFNSFSDTLIELFLLIGDIVSKKALAIISSVAAVILSSNEGSPFGKLTTESFQDTRTKDKLKATQARFAKEFRTHLPMQIDEYTTLQNVTNKGTNIVYHYTLSVTSEEIDKEQFQNEMITALKSNNCTDPNMMKIMKSGGGYRYIYQANDGIRIMNLHFSINDCDINYRGNK